METGTANFPSSGTAGASPLGTWPQVALDGGDIVYRRFENGVVYLSLQGACAGCPGSTATL